MLLKLKYNLIIMIILVAIIILIGLTSYAQEADLKGGKSAEVSTPPVPQIEPVKNLIVPGEEIVLPLENQDKGTGVSASEKNNLNLENKFKILAYAVGGGFLLLIIAITILFIRLNKFGKMPR